MYPACFNWGTSLGLLDEGLSLAKFSAGTYSQNKSKNKDVHGVN
jgi:hypothetical protein